MESRRTKRVARVEKATSQVKKNSAAGPIECSTYSFTTGAPVTTEVLVARGVVAAPEQAAFEIVPMASASSPLFVFTDETVNSLYGDRFIGKDEERARGGGHRDDLERRLLRGRDDASRY